MTIITLYKPTRDQVMTYKFWKFINSNSNWINESYTFFSQHKIYYDL